MRGSRQQLIKTDTRAQKQQALGSGTTTFTTPVTQEEPELIYLPPSSYSIHSLYDHLTCDPPCRAVHFIYSDSPVYPSTHINAGRRATRGTRPRNPSVHFETTAPPHPSSTCPGVHCRAALAYGTEPPLVDFWSACLPGCLPSQQLPRPLTNNHTRWIT